MTTISDRGSSAGAEPHPGPDPPRVVDPSPPEAVDRPVMINRWEHLTFLHWPYPPQAVQAVLPQGLTVETYDGVAWVGLVPFHMTVHPPAVPPLPWASFFPETNVRTYVIGPDGDPGVFFLSLEAARFGAVAVGRGGYHVPYFWARMAVTRSGPVTVYRSRRWWPGPWGAGSSVAVEVGSRFASDELTERDHWLTARWRLYGAFRRGLRTARADHPVWPLHRARLLHLEQDLVEAAGLPSPEGPALVHYSPGVEVRIGAPWDPHLGRP